MQEITKRYKITDNNLLDGALETLYSQIDSARDEAMVLGSYHMHNPGADIVNVAADDVLTEKRQKEILSGQ